MSACTRLPASHRTALLLLLVASSSRGLSFSRGNLNDVGAVCFALVLLGLAALVWRGDRWTGSSDTKGGFPSWVVALPLLYAYLFSTHADRHLLVFSPEDWRPTLVMITNASLLLALPALSLAWPPMRQRLSSAGQCALLLLPMAPILVLFALVTSASPNPIIDVFIFQTQGVAALGQGINPYNIIFNNAYGGGELYPGGVARYYPYPPLSLLFAAIGSWLGDVRWSLILCHIATAALLGATGRERGLPSVEAIAFGGLFLCMPQGPFLSEQAWTDPSVTLALAAMSWLLARRQPERALWAAGVALALKQTMVVLLPLLWGLWRRVTPRRLIAVGSIGAVSYGVFLAWNAGALIQDVVTFHLETPFRPLGLTLSAYLVHFHDVGPLPGWSSIVGIVGGSWAGVSALRRTEGEPDDSLRVTQLFVGLAFTFLLTLALSKHAFMNYFYQVHFALMAALIWSRINDHEVATETGA